MIADEMTPTMRNHAVPLILVILAYLASLAFVDPRGDFPLNDDWVYARAASNTAEAGRVVLTRLESAWSLPQIVGSALAIRAFGFSHTLFRGLGVATMIGVVLLTDAYLARVGLPSKARLIAAAALIFNPVMYMMGLTFMTDLPFLVLWMAACYAWDAALATGRKPWVVAASLLSMVALAQRQFALFIPMSVGLLLLLGWAMTARDPRRADDVPFAIPSRSRWALLGLVGPFVLFAIISAWWKTANGHQMPLGLFDKPVSVLAEDTYKSSLLLALTSLPLLLILNGPATSPRLRRASVFIFLLAALLAYAAWMFGKNRTMAALPYATILLLFFLIKDSPDTRHRRIVAILTAAIVMAGLPQLIQATSPLYGNLLSEFGIFRPNEVILGDRPVIFGQGFNRLATLLGLIGLAAAIPRLAYLRTYLVRAEDVTPVTGPDNPAAARGNFGYVLILSSIMYVALFNSRPSPLDRYLLPAIPGLWVALARWGPRTSPIRRWLSWAFVAASAALAITLAHDYFRWNDARWEAAESLVREGVPSETINGGYEWNGWQNGTPWMVYLPRDCRKYEYLISHSPETDGYEAVHSLPWHSVWPPHDRQVHVLRRVDPPDSAELEPAPERPATP